MAEFLLFFIPLLAICSFMLGYVFKGSFSTWLLKRKTKQSYLDEVPLVIKDNNAQANEVVEKLLTTVEYIVDGNLIADTPTLQKQTNSKLANLNPRKGRNETKDQEFEQKNKTLEQLYAQRPSIDIWQDDFYAQARQAQSQLGLSQLDKTAQETISSTTLNEQLTHAQQDKVEFEIVQLDQELESETGLTTSLLDQALQKGHSKRQRRNQIDEIDEVIAARSLEDLQHSYGVLANDVGHLLEMQMLGGVIAMQRGDYARAIKIFRHILSIPSWKMQGHQLAQMNLARCYLNAGMYSRALENLFPLIGDEKYGSEVLELLLHIYHLSSNWQAALAVAKEIYNQHKTKANLTQLSHFYMFRLLESYQQLGHRRTMFSFQRIIELNGDSLRPLITRGHYHFALGDYASALADYQLAVKQRFDVLPALVYNIYYCFAHLNKAGEDFKSYLLQLRAPAKWQYLLDLYYDMDLSGFPFSSFSSSFDFANKAVHSAQAFHAQVVGKTPNGLTTQTLKAKKNLLEEKNYRTVDLLDRLNSLISLYQQQPEYALLQRIFALNNELITNLDDAELNASIEKIEVKSVKTKTKFFDSFLGWAKRKESNSVPSAKEEYQEVAQDQAKLHKLGRFKEKLALLSHAQEVHNLQSTYICKTCGYQQEQLFWCCASCYSLESFVLQKVEFSNKMKQHPLPINREQAKEQGSSNATSIGEKHETKIGKEEIITKFSPTTSQGKTIPKVKLSKTLSNANYLGVNQESNSHSLEQDEVMVSILENVAVSFVNQEQGSKVKSSEDKDKTAVTFTASADKATFISSTVVPTNSSQNDSLSIEKMVKEEGKIVLNEETVKLNPVVQPLIPTVEMLPDSNKFAEQEGAAANSNSFNGSSHASSNTKSSQTTSQSNMADYVTSGLQALANEFSQDQIEQALNKEKIDKTNPED